MNCLVYKKKLTRINVKYLIAFSLMMFCLFVVFPQGKDSSAAAYDKVMLAANAAFNAGEYAKSEALWRQCLGYTAKIADVYFWLGMARFAQADPALAIDWFKGVKLV